MVRKCEVDEATFFASTSIPEGLPPLELGTFACLHLAMLCVWRDLIQKLPLIWEIF
jgi:hypothetical protein